jgi:hypothetical protein
VLESERYVGTSGPRTMFSIETNSGKLISGHSYFRKEDEILLPPGRYFKVIDKSNPAVDLHIIHLREIQPPYLLLAEPSPLKYVPNSPTSQKEQPINPPTSPIPKSPVKVTTPQGKFIRSY